MTLSYQLQQYLRENPVWHSKGKLTADLIWKHKNGFRFLPDSVSTTLRKLERNKIVAVKPDGVSVMYKYIPVDLRKIYIPTTSRLKGQERKLFI